jgi:hypothetical protein
MRTPYCGYSYPLLPLSVPLIACMRTPCLGVSDPLLPLFVEPSFPIMRTPSSRLCVPLTFVICTPFCRYLHPSFPMFGPPFPVTRTPALFATRRTGCARFRRTRFPEVLHPAVARGSVHLEGSVRLMQRRAFAMSPGLDGLLTTGTGEISRRSRRRRSRRTSTGGACCGRAR